MRVDVVCAGMPFLDLIFRGLPRIPEAGEEALAAEVVIVPGAMANVAFALRQLGLEAVVCSPVGTDPAGRFLQALMAEAGIPWIGDPADTTPISVGLPVDGERAFVTVMPEAAIDTESISALAPRAVVVNLPVPMGMPSGPRTFAVVGDPQVAILLDRPPEPLTGLRALFLNEREACNLTGLSDSLAAATRLATRGCPVIVTRGAEGAAVALPDGSLMQGAPAGIDALDTVAAGDLFTAAFIWADLLDRSHEECLDMAIAYASHSLATPSSRQKGLTRAAFVAAVASTTRPGSWLLEV